jgi:hypothetical protein
VHVPSMQILHGFELEGRAPPRTFR